MRAFPDRKWNAFSIPQSRLPQNQIPQPADARMRPRSLAMLDDFFAVAAGVHQGVAKDRHALEDSFVVNGEGHIAHGGREPARIHRYRADRVAGYVANQLREHAGKMAHLALTARRPSRLH